MLKIRIANKKKAKEVTAVDMSKKATQERLEEKQRAVTTEKKKTPKTKKTARGAKSEKKEKVEMRSLDFTKKK